MQTRQFRTVIDNRVHFNLDARDRCPCGSDKLVVKCCAPGGVLFRTQRSTVPKPPPKTSVAIDTCYARDLRDCDDILSREHYVSKALLQYLDSHGGLHVSGLPWQKADTPNLPPQAFTAKVLCKRHNSALSPLDALAVRFFEACNEGDVAPIRGAHLFLFSGHDIERWLLKVLAGMLASKNLESPSRLVPTEWAETLFGERAFGDGQGLYVCRQIGHVFTGSGLAIRAIGSSERLTGVSVSLCGYEFILSMRGIPSRKFDGRLFAYRPFELHTIGSTFEKSIAFSWDGPRDAGTIECVNSKRADSHDSE